MKTFSKNAIKGALSCLIGLLFIYLITNKARADVAPPEAPPGVVILPGNELTQVRMISEVVVLTLDSVNLAPKARTTADFLMENQGSSDETMNVRFPLIYGEALYYENIYPEIKDFAVKIDGQNVQTHRITSKSEGSDRVIPWASFQVTFPVGKTVKISAVYTAYGFGYEPFLTFRYILETGAGWKGTIGSGDIIVNLPYEANEQNIILDNNNGFSKIAGPPTFSGNQVKWHFENLEPTNENNFQLDTIYPAYWKKVLDARANTIKYPNDGESWGQLGKAIKETIKFQKGFLRDDLGAQILYKEAFDAYGKSVKLLPRDALWHYGYADLIWAHLITGNFNESGDYSEMQVGVNELRTSLMLDPKNQNAIDLADNFFYFAPWAINRHDSVYDYKILTMTPTWIPPTLTPNNALIGSPTTTNQPSENIPVETAIGTPSPIPTKIGGQVFAPENNQKPVTARNPLCISFAVFPLLLSLMWLFTHRISG